MKKLILLFTIIFTACNSSPEDNLKYGIESFENGDYNLAVNYFSKIPKQDSLFNKALPYVIKIDSILKLTEEEKRISEAIKLEKIKNEEKIKLKEQLERELKSINDGVKFAEGNTIEELQMDLVVFGIWSQFIKEAEESDDSEIKNLGKKLQSKVSQIQIKEFPKLREQYSKIVASKMWEHDINVTSNGSGKKYINFSGGVFAANKNIKDFQIEINEILEMFRFNQARYRWYKEASEYTYYTIYEGKDSDPVSFRK